MGLTVQGARPWKAYCKTSRPLVQCSGISCRAKSLSGPAGRSPCTIKRANGPAANYPRAYGIALELISHVDGRVDAVSLNSYVATFAWTVGQTENPSGVCKRNAVGLDGDVATFA